MRCTQSNGKLDKDYSSIDHSVTMDEEDCSRDQKVTLDLKPADGCFACSESLTQTCREAAITRNV